MYTGPVLPWRKYYAEILTIAGSDSGGGAGIQADLKTIEAHSMYGMSVITALTAQNTKEVLGVFITDPDFFSLQIEAVFKEFPPDAIKVGMLANAEVIRSVADALEKYEVKNLVVDPVMISTSGKRLLEKGALI
jgi:hydroxymethylpyrimidine/phosphomethylpyrimidine kinase